MATMVGTASMRQPTRCAIFSFRSPQTTTRSKNPTSRSRLTLAGTPRVLVFAQACAAVVCLPAGHVLMAAIFGVRLHSL